MNVTRRSAASAVWILMLSLAVAGCGGNSETRETGSVSQPAGSRQGLAIDFRSEPDPPKSGQNAVEVDVKNPDGTPVTDATVKVVFSMPAMPSMNMPAMKTETTLAHDSGGRYRGEGALQMAGTWNVNVMVSRGAEEIGSRNLSIVAK